MNSKKPFRWWLTLLWTWQVDFITMVVVLFARVVWGDNLIWRDGLWVMLRENSWPTRTWFKGWGGVTLCHGGLLLDIKALPHELIHVEQTEARMLSGLVVGMALMVITVILGGGLVQAVAVMEIPWLGGWLIGYFSTIAQAYLRGEKPYRGSHLEEAAYALQDKLKNK